MSSETMGDAIAEAWYKDKAELNRLRAENERLKDIVRAFTGCAYIVSTQINKRGYNWSEAYLDEALALVRKQAPEQMPPGRR
jgi:hypothetical protein